MRGAIAKTKNTEAATLYENALTIQSAADIGWHASDPANAGVRDEFLLGILLRDHDGNHTPPAPTPRLKHQENKCTNI